MERLVITNRPLMAQATRPRGGGTGFLLLLCSIMLSALALTPRWASADQPLSLEHWRARASDIRRLADENVPLAHEQARALHDSQPANAWPSDRIRALNLLARTAVRLGQGESAEEYARRAIGLAERHNDLEGLAEAHLVRACVAYIRGHINLIAPEAAAAMNALGGAAKPELLVEAMLHIVRVEERLGHRGESVLMALRARDIAKDSGHALALALAYHGMAISKATDDTSASTRELFTEMLKAARQSKSTFIEIIAIINLAQVYAAEGQLATAEQMLLEALPRARQLGAPKVLAEILHALAETHRIRQQHDAAQHYLGEMIEILETLGIDIVLWKGLMTLGAIQATTGKLSEATTSYQRSYGIARKLELPDLIRSSARELSAVLARRGRHHEAYEVISTAESLVSNTIDDHTKTLVHELAQRYQRENRQREIDDLSLAAERQAAHHRWLLTLFLSVLALLVAGTLHLARQRRTNHELALLNQELQNSRDNLRALAARREDAREEERKRIAHELHDELGQLLTALRLEIAAFDYRFGNEFQFAAQYCQRLQETTDKASRSVRALTTSLRPAVLDRGIEAALRWLVDDVGQRIAIQCNMNASGTGPEPSERQSITIFRIVQESLTNVARHAQARRVDVDFRQDERGFHLRVQDDGRGFDPNAPRLRSFGLTGIHERAFAVGGYARIDSAPGKGATIEVFIPRGEVPPGETA